MAIYKLNINGKQQEVDVDPATPILWVLTEHLNLLGTKYSWGNEQNNNISRGVAAYFCHNSYVAHVVDMKMVSDYQVR